MSEKLVSTEKSQEITGLNEKALENLKFLQEKAKEAKHKPAEHIELLRHQAKQEAISKESAPLTNEDKPAVFTASPHDLKTSAYSQTMKRVRKRLNSPERAFSSILHQPVVESVSDISSKTVARPSGLLGGGLVALLGSSLLLFLSKRYGFQYNYLVFLFLFLSGFALGTLLELLLYPFLRKRRVRQ